MRILKHIIRKNSAFYRVLKKMKFSFDKIYYSFYRKKKAKLIQRISKKETINVCFFAMDVSMWKYSGIMSLMKNNKRFNPVVVLSPRINGTKEQRLKDAEQMRSFFSEKGFTYVDYTEETRGYDIYEKFSPDIAFYTQPYARELEKHSIQKSKNTLLCYVPYCFWTQKGSMGYNMPLHKMAWKLFYPTYSHLEEAEKYSVAGSKNIQVSGYPLFDDFLEDTKDPWKIKDSSVKRIIWAPHYSIKEIVDGVEQSNFLETSDIMLNLLDKYRDKIQIAFKPHPRLKTTLYDCEGWGIERTNSYYDLWNNLPNGQLATGYYIDLFKTSDALIHDSDSFMVEYQYTQKPSFFISKDPNTFASTRSKFGKKTLNLHYLGYTEKDINDFIIHVIFKNDDPKKVERVKFYTNELLPPDGKSCSENIVNHILNSLQ